MSKITAILLAAIVILDVALIRDAHAAATVLDPAGSQSVYQRDADRALAPTPDVTVVVYQQDCPDPGAAPGRGCTYPDGRIYLPGGYDPEGFLHELGHQFDYATTNDTALRPSFQAEIRERARGWRGGANPPNEQFAEAWRWCAEYGDTTAFPDEWELGYSYQPRRGACRTIARAGAVFTANRPAGRLLPAQVDA